MYCIKGLNDTMAQYHHCALKSSISSGLHAKYSITWQVSVQSGFTFAVAANQIKSHFVLKPLQSWIYRVLYTWNQVMKDTIQNEWPSRSTTAICVNKHHIQHIHLKGNYKTVWCSRLVLQPCCHVYCSTVGKQKKFCISLNNRIKSHTDHKGNQSAGVQQKAMALNRACTTVRLNNTPHLFFTYAAHRALL